MRNWLRTKVAAIWVFVSPYFLPFHHIIDFGSEAGEAKVGAAAGAGAIGVGGLAATRGCRSLEEAGEGIRVVTSTGEEGAAAMKLGENAARATRLGEDGRLISGLGDEAYPGSLSAAGGRLNNGLNLDEGIGIGTRPAIVPRPVMPVLIEKGDVAFGAVRHERVILVDADGDPIRLEPSVAHSAELQYRERASRILDQALTSIPASEWKSEIELQQAIVKALQDEPAGSYSFDVTSGKLTLKTKVRKLEINGEMNIYKAAAKAGTAAGLGYGFGRVDNVTNAVNQWLGNRTPSDKVTKPQDGQNGRPQAGTPAKDPGNPEATPSPSADIPVEGW